MTDPDAPDTTPELRKVQVHRSTGWTTVRMAAIKRGDIFRLFEPDGTPVIDAAGRSMWKATKDASLVYPNYYGGEYRGTLDGGPPPSGHTESDSLPPGTMVQGVMAQDWHEPLDGD